MTILKLKRPRVFSALLIAATIAGFLPPATAQEMQRDLILVLDGSRAGQAISQKAAGVVIDSLGDKHRLGIIVAGESHQLLLPLGPVSTVFHKDKAHKAISQVAYQGDTIKLSAALELALGQWSDSKSSEDASKVVLIVMADASSQENIAADDVLPRYLQNKIVVNGVSVGGGNSSQLGIIAGFTGGRYLGVHDENAIQDALEALLESSVGNLENQSLKQLTDIEEALKQVQFEMTRQQQKLDALHRKAPPRSSATPLIVTILGLIVALGTAFLVWFALFFQKRQRLARLGIDRESTVAGGASIRKLRDVSNQLNNALVDASDMSDALNTQVEDFSIDKWRREKAWRERFGNLSSDLFLLVDHLSLDDAGSGQLDALWVKDKLHRLLSDVSVSTLTPEEGTAFDSARHKVTGEKHDASKAGTILSVQREGYVIESPGGNEDPVVLRPAEVIVSMGNNESGN